jgi:hypothetical protein
MTRDIEETRERLAQQQKVEAAVAELMEVLGDKEVNIGISALLSYLCTLAYKTGYPRDKLLAYVTTLYEMHEKKP